MSAAPQVLRQGHFHADAPLRCGVQLYEASCYAEFRTPQYALVYLSTGAARFMMDGESWEVTAGDAFQRLPGRSHAVTYEAGTLTHFLALPASVYDVMEELHLPGLSNPVLRLGVDHGFLARHRILIDELRASAPQQLLAVMTRMQMLMVDMHLHAQARLQGGRYRREMEQACLRLAQDLKRPLDVSALARELGMGYSLFRRVFREATGLAPQAYRIRRRLERAQEMLLEGRAISSVARELGYSDLYAFSAQFRKFIGLSPRAYRQSRMA